jgi:hypothetical protein
MKDESGNLLQPSSFRLRPLVLRLHPASWRGFSLPPRPGVLALTCLLMLGLYAALRFWGHGHGAPAGIDLRAASSSPKLNITSAGAPAAAPQTESVAPPILEPPAIIEPALENGYRNSHRGDSPMIRNWNMLAAQALLVGALVPAAAQAQTPTSDTPPKPIDPALVSKQLEDLKKSIDAMEKRLGDSLLAMGKDVRDVINDFQNFKTDANLKLGKAQADIDDLKKQLAQVRQDFDGGKSRPPSREAGYAAPPGSPPAAGTGRVRLVNTFSDAMTIIVNAKAYQLAPGETKLSDALPAGTFTYEVLGVQPSRERQLAANETFTVTVHPR